MEIIKLYSRYNEPRYIEKISNTEYLVYGKTEWIKINTGGNYIDFEGGPSFVVGGFLPTFLLKINSISRMGNKGDMTCFKLTV